MFLPDDLSSYLAAEGSEADRRILESLSSFNFFVGPNNSGKSRLLRRIAANESPRVRLSIFPKYLDNAKKSVLDGLRNHAMHVYLDSLMEAWFNLEYVKVGSNFGLPRSSLSDAIGFINRGVGSSMSGILSRVIKDFDSYMESDSFGRIMNGGVKRIYIPTLRGLRPLLEDDSAKSDDLYARRTLADYFGPNENPSGFKGEIYTGLTFYHDLRNLLLGDHGSRKAARDFETFLSQELFGGESITLIPREGKDVVYFKLGGAQERPIHSVGDGLQHLIILTFPLFKYRDEPSQVFIEEPELFLHPGMQRALIKAMRKFPHHQYFIATHSNHLLDLTLEFDDISIYTLSREEELNESDITQAKFEISLVSSHDFRALEMLGARSSSVFLSNCTIWVEGITDRRYLTHYLHLYVEHLEREAGEGESRPFLPRQDLHYLFVEYSGGNITHWSFLDKVKDPILVERLCSKAMLITDKDKNKDERHETLKKNLKEDYYCLDCSEIENLLTPSVLRKVLVGYGEDEISIRGFTQKQYAGKKLGRFLEGRLKTKKRQGSYFMASGTVSDKLKFCELAIEAMPLREQLSSAGIEDEAFEFDQLSDEAQQLTIKLYDFIKAQNHR
ncbi:MAG: AAA family ATPase [Luteolibacter sp.]